MNYGLTEHAKESLQKRANIRLEWLEQALTTPHRVEPDRIDPNLEHRIFRVDEFDGRVLRVVLNANVNPVRIITVFLIAV
ncbi:MAG: hypothetical protein CTY18_08880 [Methylomonas sp.]|nr:MAG: hypothetical protein CTY18_08880 [Methylomonas sp.]